MIKYFIFLWLMSLNGGSTAYDKIFYILVANVLTKSHGYNQPII
jgi:hypothetical protein